MTTTLVPVQPEIKPFHGFPMTVVAIDGMRWLKAIDLAGPTANTERAIRKLVASLPENERGELQVPTLGGTQTALFVSEAGALEVCARSKSPLRTELIRWVVQMAVTPGPTRPLVAPNGPEVLALKGQVDALVEKFAALERTVLKSQRGAFILPDGTIAPPYLADVERLRKEGFWVARSWLEREQRVTDEKIVTATRSLVGRAVAYFKGRVRLKTLQTRTLVRGCGHKKVWLVHEKYLDALYFADASAEARSKRLAILERADLGPEPERKQGELFDSNVIPLRGRRRHAKGAS
jgi:hypothetical protein